MQVARRSDMDMNGHINNVTYLAWALETVPADVYLNYSLQQACHPCCVTRTKSHLSRASPQGRCLDLLRYN